MAYSRQEIAVALPCKPGSALAQAGIRLFDVLDDGLMGQYCPSLRTAMHVQGPQPCSDDP